MLPTWQMCTVILWHKLYTFVLAFWQCYTFVLAHKCIMGGRAEIGSQCCNTWFKNCSPHLSSSTDVLYMQLSYCKEIIFGPALHVGKFLITQLGSNAMQAWYMGDYIFYLKHNWIIVALAKINEGSFISLVTENISP